MSIKRRAPDKKIKSFNYKMHLPKIYLNFQGADFFII